VKAAAVAVGPAPGGGPQGACARRPADYPSMRDAGAGVGDRPATGVHRLASLGSAVPSRQPNAWSAPLPGQEAYSQEISRKFPALVIFLLDQSLSMQDKCAGTDGESKAAVLAEAINRILHELVVRSKKGEEIRHYFDVAVLGYGHNPGAVSSAFKGGLAGRQIVNLSEIAFNPAELEEKSQSPIWIYPVADGATPLCAALGEARMLADGWVTTHMDSFPPIVLNISDGEATDGDPTDEAAALRQIKTNFGHLLLFNCHLSGSRSAPVSFPVDREETPKDAFARRLFSMSSPFPDAMLNRAIMEGLPIRNGARGFMFNADATELVRFLSLGTRPTNQSMMG
jgi:hypothetical protein